MAQRDSTNHPPAMSGGWYTEGAGTLAAAVEAGAAVELASPTERHPRFNELCARLNAGPETAARAWALWQRSSQYLCKADLGDFSPWFACVLYIAGESQPQPQRTHISSRSGSALTSFLPAPRGLLVEVAAATVPSTRFLGPSVVQRSERSKGSSGGLHREAARVVGARPVEVVMVGMA